MSKPKPTYYGNEDQYPRYDNYDAIEVSRTMHIPCDYDGVIGVPITFLESYNPKQFDILGITTSPSHLDNKDEAKRIVAYKEAVQLSPGKEKQYGGKVNDGAVILLSSPPSQGTYYNEPSTNKYLRLVYARILIKRKEKADG